MRIIPYMVAALQIVAGGIYLYHKEWRLSLIWFGVSVANMALAGIK